MRAIRTLLAVFFALAAASAWAQALPVERLLVKSKSGKQHAFVVEVARSDAEKAAGLMFRTEMAAGKGMLFLFDPPQQASFWMENTFIPLDMIFIRKDGRIANIIANAKPMTRDQRRSKGPVAYVLEINGGLAAKLGIKPGDKVSSPSIRPR